MPAVHYRKIVLNCFDTKQTLWLTLLLALIYLWWPRMTTILSIKNGEYGTESDFSRLSIVWLLFHHEKPILNPLCVLIFKSLKLQITNLAKAQRRWMAICRNTFSSFNPPLSYFGMIAYEVIILNFSLPRRLIGMSLCYKLLWTLFESRKLRLYSSFTAPDWLIHSPIC